MLMVRWSTSRWKAAAMADCTSRLICLALRRVDARMWISAMSPSSSSLTLAENTPGIFDSSAPHSCAKSAVW